MTSRKRGTGVFAMAVAITAALLLHATPAQAYSTWGDHRLINGVGNYGSNNQYYYVDATASAHRNTAIAAMNDWIYTTTRTGVTTPISFLRTTYRPSSKVDIVQVNYVAPWWGFTTHYNGNTMLEPWDGNWYWALIQLDGAFAQCPNQKGVIAHEIGHAMGLAHVTTASSVMYDEIAYTSVTAAVADDLNGINHLY